METREKQAYMLMAHQCNEMFWTLLRMLDAPWNDIFIHMDSKNENYQPETVERYVKYAKVFHAQRTSAVWGGITLVKAEFVSVSYTHLCAAAKSASVPVQATRPSSWTRPQTSSWQAARCV